MNVLEEANEITQGARRDSYGHPSVSYKRLSIMWSLILDHEVTPHQAGLMMIALKMAREMNTPHRDNLVDIAGYARTLEMLDEVVDNNHCANQQDC